MNKRRYRLILLSVFLLGTHSANAAPQTLQDAWIQAYQNNPSLEAERAKLRATDELVSQALSHWRPTVEATGDVGKTYQYIPSQQPFGTDHFADTTRGYGVQVTQPVFRGFRTLSETEAAEKQVMAGRAKLQSAEQQLLMDVASAYLDTVRDEAILGIDINNEQVLKQKLDETKARAEAGELTQTDVQQAQSRLARTQVSRLQEENTLAAARSAFARLVGDMPGTLQKPELQYSGPHDMDDIVNTSLKTNPEILSGQYAYDEAQAEVEQNKGNMLPELDVVGSSSRSWGENSTLPGRFDSSQVLLQLTVPLYRGGADSSKIRQAQQTVVQRRMELEDSRNRVRETARNAWQQLRTTEAAIKADHTEIDACAQALEGVKVQAKVGTRTTLDVLNAEQELLDARVDLARSEHDRNLSVLQIQSAKGLLTADALRLPIRAYDPKEHYDEYSGALVSFGGAQNDVYAKSALKNPE